jgi:hypothetical protein
LRISPTHGSDSLADAGRAARDRDGAAAKVKARAAAEPRKGGDERSERTNRAEHGADSRSRRRSHFRRRLRAKKVRKYAWKALSQTRLVCFLS